MRRESIAIGGIPALVWGEPADRVFLYVHGKRADKESAADLAQAAAERGWQTLSFDLPSHGERAAAREACDIWNGVRDLRAAADYAAARWERTALSANSLGAFFSLHAFQDRPFERCLFQSPIVDMVYLIGQMFQWFGVTEDALQARGEIDTPVETLSWPYYQYVREHPVLRWATPTCILYGGRDAMQSRGVMEAFARRFGCCLTISEESDHPFLHPAERAAARAWMRACLAEDAPV